MTTGITIGRRRVRSSMNLPSERRAWRRSVSRSNAPSAIAGAIAEGAYDFDTLRRHARRSLGKFIDQRTRRRPIVIPVVMEV
jgi:mRNA degradation ribonuclease J1/J2